MIQAFTIVNSKFEEHVIKHYCFLPASTSKEKKNIKNHMWKYGGSKDVLLI